MRFVYTFIITFFCTCSVVYSQQITVNNSVGLQTLVEDNFVNGCVEITNITSSINGISSGTPSYAYFERGSSNFPFENGIMLSTGNANSGGNSSNANLLSEGTSSWGTDPDIEAALGISNTLNATSIEFDFVSVTNQFQFNYLFASEEYFEDLPCVNVTDHFVFLITEAGSGNPYRNIAVLPNSTPVNSVNIRNGSFGCPASNDTYFGSLNIGDTNYNGRTTVLTASETIVPYVQYHVKLIIADQRDFRNDSAIFIEANSFDILDLGEDIQTCSSSVTLDADIQNPFASYTWSRNGTVLVGETNPTLNVLLDGTYRVDVNIPLGTGGCDEFDEIEIVLNSEETIDPISNYIICDDVSGDGIETFNLSTKLSEVATSVGSTFTSYIPSFHFSDFDARNNLNPITGPFSNSTNPQTIYVRIDDLNSNCFAYATFDLVVSTPPAITAPTPLEACDSDDDPSDQITVIDLTEKDNEITGGLPNLVVSYHYNARNASSGVNAIPGSYLNTLPVDTVYVRVVDTNTGCFNTTTLTVNVTSSPIITRDTQFIDACDTDHNGNATFNLNDRVNNILNGLTGVTVTFHENFADADTGDNAIGDPSNYEYTNPNGEPGSRSIYVRVVDDVTGCASITIIEVHTNLLLTGTDTGDFALCDTNNDANDTLDFNLEAVETYINDDLTDPVTVTFYETEDDLNNNVNAIDKTVPYSATSPTVLYIRLEDASSGCVENSEITLLVNPILLFEPTAPVEYCDNDDDGIVSIDLHSLDDLVTSNNSNFTVSYFATDADAQANVNPLPPFYTNSTPTETIYARIESILAGCSTVNPFQIEVKVAPGTTLPTPFNICDDDGINDGFYIVNLESKLSEMITSTTGVDINFFVTENDALNNTNPIATPTTFNAQTQIVYTRFENTEGCFNITPIEIVINTRPEIPNDLRFQMCEATGTTVADFLLVEMDDDILGVQTGKEVYYFEDETDALAGNLGNAINKNVIYQNTSNPQTIYIRVENITANTGTCFATSTLTLQISSDPIYNSIVDFFVCDDSSNDGISQFDLQAKRDEIALGSPDNLNISFHSTFNDADNDINPLGDNYTNTLNPQTIFIRIESDTSLCHVVETLGINIIAAPNVTQVSAPLTNCDTDYDGFTSFNLTNADFELLDRITDNLVIHYFENLSDINENNGLDNSLSITNPTSFNSNTQTVYIKIANTFTGCFTVIPLDLIVNLPPTTNTIGTIQICDNDTDTYDLSIIDDLIVNDTSIVNISYHHSFIEAENNSNAIGNIYNYTSNLHTIFIRVSNTTNGCHITTSFNLEIFQNPIANVSPDLVSCDDDFDGFFEFDLTLATPYILGTQSSSVFIVTYHTSMENAENDENPLGNTHSSSDGEVIYARIENNATDCYDITQFTTRVNPLPIVPIEDIVTLCTDDLPLVIDANTGNPNDTYLWSTSATTPQIILNDPSEIGNYTVTVTRSNAIGRNCDYTHNFTVIDSETANIEVTIPVNFADPNSITVNINGIGDYVYILDDGDPQTSNVFNNVSYGVHLVTIRDLNGCSDIVEEVVVIDAPKFFTPNGDMFHSTWHIVGIEEIPGTVVTIYNRHGKLLKTLTHTSEGWDGTFNGYNMPSDDYWFVAKVIYQGETFDVRGHFALKR